MKKTEKFDADIIRAENRHEKVLFIHNHPNNSPPSVADLNELLRHKYAIGITVGHKGSIYLYSKPKSKIMDSDFRVALMKTKDYNGVVNIEAAMKYLASEFEFTLKEL